MTIAVPKGTEPVAIAVPGIVAFTTTRARGDFNVLGDRPSGDVLQRWLTLQDELGVTRFGYAKQVHGNRVVVHNAGWTGWLRVPDADGHLTNTPSTALAVTLADCVPIFLSHASGMIGLLHAGWRGTSAGIVGRAIEELRFRGVPAHELSAHLGPAICGTCYEVGPEVIAAVLRRHVASPQPLDLRHALGEQLRTAGVRQVTAASLCTRCDNDRFFSHRAGDAGRHIAVIARIA